jgi:hypothetical protein
MAYTFTLKEKQDIMNAVKNMQKFSSPITVSEITANYSVTSDDYRKFLSGSGTFTVTLPNATALSDGFHLFIKNNGSTEITVKSSLSTQLIDNDASKSLSPNEGIMIVCNGTKFFSFHAASFIAL